MVDYGIDGSFRVPITGYGSLEEVDGVKEFEQNVAIKIHDEMKRITGEFISPENQEQKLRLAITRTAREFDLIDEIRTINITDAIATEGRYEIEIIYFSEEDFSEVF